MKLLNRDSRFLVEKIHPKIFRDTNARFSWMTPKLKHKPVELFDQR